MNKLFEHEYHDDLTLFFTYTERVYPYVIAQLGLVMYSMYVDVHAQYVRVCGLSS